MRRIAHILLAGALLLKGGGADAALDAYLKIDGVAGTCTNDPARADWIEILAFGHGMSQPAATAGGAGGSGRESNRVSHGDFTVAKTLDAASPRLSLACVEGRHFDRVKIDVVRRVGGRPETYFQIEMRHCLVSSIRLTGDPTNGPSEEVTFRYGSLSADPAQDISWEREVRPPPDDPLAPFVAVTSRPPSMVDYGVTNVALAGTNANVTGGMWWYNSTAEQWGFFDPSGAGWSASVGPLSVGTNLVYVYGTNASGQSDADSVLLRRASAAESTPEVAVTNKPGAPLPYATASFPLAGTNNAFVAGAMWWTNHATGGYAAFTTAGGAWNATVSPLSAGRNQVAVYGTNLAGALARDAVSIQRGDGSERPEVDVTAAPTGSLPYATISWPLSGTNNAAVAPGLWWIRNGPGTSSTGAFSAVANAWTATVDGIEVGLNAVYVFGTNLWGETAMDAVTLARDRPGDGEPYLEITNAPPEMLAWDATAFALEGTNNPHVAPAMWWSNSANAAAGAFTATGGAWTATVSPLAGGINDVYVYGTNLWGSRHQAAMSIPRAYDPGAPFLQITNAPPTNVAWSVTAFDLAGTNNAFTVGPLWWVRNSADGTGGGSFASTGGAWSVTVTDLRPGMNDVYVYGSNAAGRIALDVASVLRERDEGPAVVDITNEPPARLDYRADHVLLIGTNNALAGAGMWWVNLDTGAGGTFTAAAGAWSLDIGGLRYGPNTLYVFGTNAFSQLAVDAATVSRDYPPGTRFVSPGGPDIFPYTSWTTAASRIQHAVDAARTGELVVVAAGVYAEGARMPPGGSLQTRLLVTNAIEIVSLQGPAYTIIEGASDPAAGGIGPNAARVVWMSGGAELSGFTIMGGRTRSDASPVDRRGGGVWLEGGAVLTNCMVVGNAAFGEGGGIYLDGGGGGSGGAAVSGCRVEGNHARQGGGIHLAGGGSVSLCAVSNNLADLEGGGVYAGGGGRVEWSHLAGNRALRSGGGFCAAGGGELADSVVESNLAARGGGLYLEGPATAPRCTVRANRAEGLSGVSGDTDGGGGAYLAAGAQLLNAVVHDNTAARYGGGVYLGGGGGGGMHLTICHNHADYGGGGVYGESGGVFMNSVVYYNEGGTGAPDYDGAGLLFDHSCLTPPAGPLCIPGPPGFADAAARDYRLSMGSPCIDSAGPGAADDRDGVPRPLDGNADGLALPDMGAYEFAHPLLDSDGDQMPDGWEAGHGLNPLEATGDDGPDGDPDRDGMTNLGERAADTDPSDRSSKLALVRIEREADGIRLVFTGGREAWQFLESRPVLGSATNEWSVIWVGQPPTPPSNEVIRAGAPGPLEFFRLRAERP